MKLNSLVKINLNFHLEFLSKIRGAGSIISVVRTIMDDSQSEESIKKDVSFLQQSSKSKNRLLKTLSNHFLGLCYFEGISVTKEQKIAFAFYKKAADEGYPPAQCTIGCLYQYGLGVNQDIKKAQMYYRLSARQGWPLAHFRIGTCYEDGVGVKKDLKMAYKFYQFAADKGYGPAQHNLGIFYGEGRGVAVNEKKAFELFQKAIENGVPDSKINLSNSYIYGRGTNINPMRGIEILFMMTAGHDRREEVFGKMYLGFELYSGKIMIKNHERSALLLQYVEENIDCCLSGTDDDELGNKIQKINKSLKGTPDLDKVIKYHTEQINFNPRSLTILGFCYMLGLGCEQDLKKSEEYFRVALDVGLRCLWDLYFCYLIMSQTKLGSSHLYSFYRELESMQFESNPLEEERKDILYYLYRYGSVGLDQNLFKARKYQLQDNHHQSFDMLFYFDKIVKETCDSLRLFTPDIGSIIAEYAFEPKKPSGELSTRSRGWWLPPF